MIITAIFLILFGVIVIIFPQFLSLLVGLFFVFLGVNLLVIGGVFRSAKKYASRFSVGGYEIIRKK